MDHNHSDEERVDGALRLYYELRAQLQCDVGGGAAAKKY